LDAVLTRQYRRMEAEVRPYRTGDEQRIVEFLERYTGWPAATVEVPKVDHWRWKFLSSPVGFPLVCIAEGGGEILSHCASMPTLISVDGKEVLASQGVDLCTHPQYRGQGLIGRVMQCRNRMKEERGVALDYGFPNRASYHLSMAKQGFRDLAMEMVQHQFIVDRERFFRKVPLGALKRFGYASLVTLRRSLGPRGRTDLEIEAVERFSADATALYERARDRFDLIARRDADHLNWRYGDLRGGRYLRRAVREDGRLLGYAVHKVEDRDGTVYLDVVDVLVEDGRDDALAALMLDALDTAYRSGAESALCCLPQGHPYGRTLQDLGFVAQPRLTGDMPMRMIWFDRGLADLSLLGRDGLNGHVTLGDTDWV